MLMQQVGRWLPDNKPLPCRAHLWYLSGWTRFPSKGRAFTHQEFAWLAQAVVSSHSL
jgi:hypothetical protein